MNGTSGCNKSMTSSVDKLHAAKAETRINNLLLILLTHYTQYCRTTQYCSVLHLTSYVFSINTHTHTHTRTRARKGMAGNNNKCRPARSCNYYSITRKSLIYALSWPIILNGAGLLRRMFTFCLYFFFHGIFPRSVFLFWWWNGRSIDSPIHDRKLRMSLFFFFCSLSPQHNNNNLPFIALHRIYILYFYFFLSTNAGAVYSHEWMGMDELAVSKWRRVYWKRKEKFAFICFAPIRETTREDNREQW